MNNKIQITFKNIESTNQVVEYVEEKFSKLKKLHTNIIGCKAVISVPHRSHRNGNGFHVSISLVVPGKELIGQSRAKHEEGRDLYACISEAFNALQGQLKAGRFKETAARQYYTLSQAYDLAS